jgi:hypothetical protein
MVSTMDSSRLDALIALVLDHSARIDERDDAAIDLGNADDPRAVAALLQVGADRGENETILASCGESLAQIAIRGGRFDRVWLELLTPIAVNEFVESVRAERPELLEP